MVSSACEQCKPFCLISYKQSKFFTARYKRKASSVHTSTYVAFSQDRKSDFVNHLISGSFDVRHLNIGLL